MLPFKKRLYLSIIKIFRYEFWPYYVFYFPALIYGLILAIKARSLAYFTAANPILKYGGTFGMPKSEILSDLHSDYQPKMILISYPFDIEQIVIEAEKIGILFPFIIKPNIGERGIMVEKINNAKELKKSLTKRDDEFIIQEYIDFKNEIGLMYYRLPGKKTGNISSIVLRNFLTVTGDGKRSLIELMEQNVRALFRYNYLSEKYKDQLNAIIPEGKEILLEPIGNHNRGTEFLNGNHLINDKLVKVFDKISNTLNEFYYGRFDLKYNTLAELYEGKNIKVLEVNGVNSEPAHIYDPSYNLFRAYHDIFVHMKIIYDISLLNHKNGVEYAKTKIFLKDMVMHKKSH